MKDDEFNRKILELKASPAPMVDDFQRPLVKDLPVDKIDTKSSPFPTKTGAEFKADQMARQNAVKQAGDSLNYTDLKKEFANKNKFSRKALSVLGLVPGLGALSTLAATGDASAAAEELPGDIPFVGQAYDAFRPETAGDVEGEKELLAEIQASKNYKKSPAHQARLQALKEITAKK